MNKLSKVLGSICVVVIALPAFCANQVVSVHVTLPDEGAWQAATNKSDGTQYIREWLPAGATFESTDWLVVEQKLRLQKSVSAKDYLAGIMSQAKQACVSVKFNGPDAYESDGTDSYVGRFMCSQQNGKSYGTYTDQRVIADGGFVYVTTSELRVPPTTVAGTMSFGPDQLASLAKTIKRQQQSSALVRAGVKVCLLDTKGC